MKELRTVMSWRALFRAASCLTWFMICVFGSDELVLMELSILPNSCSMKVI